MLPHRLFDGYTGWLADRLTGAWSDFVRLHGKRWNIFVQHGNGYKMRYHILFATTHKHECQSQMVVVFMPHQKLLFIGHVNVINGK